MQALVETIKAWQPHPVIDHFTVALIIVGILVDLFGSVMSSRTWPRTTAVTLMVLGAVAAWGSNLTGGWEADRVWHDLPGPALAVLKRHAFLGDWLPWVFLALALWRVGIQFVGFLAGSRPIYLMVAVVAGGVILYQGHLGGELVYDYGVGTALMPTATSAESSEPASNATPAEASPLPTVFNPSEAPTPQVTESPAASPSVTATLNASPSPVASPAESGGTPVNPPGAEASPSASPGETPAPKNL